MQQSLQGATLEEVQMLIGQRDIELLVQARDFTARIREQDAAIPKLQAEILEKDRLIAEQGRTIEVLRALVDDLAEQSRSEPRALPASVDGG